MKGSFQVILIVVFIALAIFGVLVFSGAIPIGDSSNEPGGLGTVVLWGTVDSGAMSPIFEEFNKTNTTFSVQYVQKSSDTFDQDLLEALSEGKGPDLIFLPEDLAFHYANKIFPFPYQNYSLASFKTTFAGAGEVFLTKRGILALPIGIDPLVMYYNRSMLDANGVIYPPAFLDELEKLASVLQSYTDFANPNKEVYSWNKSFPESSVAFSKEDLALYFGFGRELKSLVNRNPNQNFSASPIPQIRNSTSKLTGARVMGVAVLFSSKNLNTAFVAANFMVSTDFASKFASAALMAPARRDLLAVKPPDAFSPVFFSSALFGRSWLDPSRKDTDDIFRRMVDGVLSNSMTAGEAIRDASAKLGLLLLK